MDYDAGLQAKRPGHQRKLNVYAMQAASKATELQARVKGNVETLSRTSRATLASLIHKRFSSIQVPQVYYPQSQRICAHLTGRVSL